MLNRTGSISLLTIAIFSLALACGSDDDDNGGGPGPGPGGGSSTGGTVSFEMSGDIDGAKDGFAYIGTYETDSISNYQFNFGDGDTYTLTLSRMGEGIESPSVGVYTVGTITDDDFGVSMEIFAMDNESEAISFHAASLDEDVGGMMDITSSSSSSAAGTFEFDLISYDDDGNERRVAITNGQFTANDESL